jgi:hypothetical protein
LDFLPTGAVVSDVGEIPIGTAAGYFVDIELEGIDGVVLAEQKMIGLNVAVR